VDRAHKTLHDPLPSHSGFKPGRLEIITFALELEIRTTKLCSIDNSLCCIVRYQLGRRRKALMKSAAALFSDPLGRGAELDRA
jgi:hypothetical protein